MKFDFNNKYLEKYFEILKNEVNDKSVYSERHHIFPTAIFGKNNKIVRLSFLDHLLAHYYLTIAYKENNSIDEYYKSANSLIRFFSKNKYRLEEIINLPEYDLKCLSQIMSESRKIYSNSIKGSKYYHCPITKKNVRVKLNQQPPVGYVLGLFFSDTAKLNISTAAKKKTGVKNDHTANVINKNKEKIKKTAEKHKGMKRSAESKLKMSLAKLGKKPSNFGKILIKDCEGNKKLHPKDEKIPEGWKKVLYKRAINQITRQWKVLPEDTILEAEWIWNK